MMTAEHWESNDVVGGLYAIANQLNFGLKGLGLNAADERMNALESIAESLNNIAEAIRYHADTHGKADE